MLQGGVANVVVKLVWMTELDEWKSRTSRGVTEAFTKSPFYISFTPNVTIIIRLPKETLCLKHWSYCLKQHFEHVHHELHMAMGITMHVKDKNIYIYII